MRCCVICLLNHCVCLLLLRSLSFAKLIAVPAKSIYDERELLLLLSQGDATAFEQLYRLYSARLLGNFIRLVKSEAAAAELLQSLFVKIWENRCTIDPDKSFCSYLFRIAENLVYDYFRKAARDKKLQAILINRATGQYLHVEETLYSKESAHALHDAIAALPSQRRKVFQLVKMEGRSYEEVSRLLHISTSTISDHIVKATKFIREQLGNNYELSISILLLVMADIVSPA